jgi:hypothetical protein
MTSRSLSKSRAIDCRFRIVPLLSIGLAFLDVQAQFVYQITDNVTGGIDLTAMEGYYSDRLAGPTDAEVVVEGEIKHSPARLWDSNGEFQKMSTARKEQ